jgi:thiol-disulfide isomerase/thioredoxin
VIVLLFIFDIIRTYYNNKSQNDNNGKKVSKKIEKMDPQTMNNAASANNMLTFGDLTIDPTKTNVTLYFADWCGHCKQFIGTTWNKFSEHYGDNSNIKLNKIDCTNTKSEIKTPAGKTIQGFPTVILNYVNADGEYIEEEYNGGRSYDVFSKYVEKLGTTSD